MKREQKLPGLIPVSYTHLDVYKRQELLLAAADALRLAGGDAEEELTFAAKRFTQRLEADET